ncbi:hypothetical protein DICPUDRAFT_36938 [Dictyostelium purpureum]|uniref:tRNA-splicing endonuclease subunit Sen34 n=1 Tax=Dictyostelium purpureum TaxID=5786 RepID=F0ZRY7_DICPU|nr:uncharacterized protein DICPUDRAFT_36938 [Dictyostelium purpureum]EGC33290.1 hypothetical protein DICPUDRAFT_36938 [Dictyostelium purpureum]|eukprot:XP_003290191.1 hypothetical protein DICPUDRAFT_36938 [Dictyostelium purpureum]
MFDNDSNKYNNKVINIYLINNNDALVWNTDDIYQIRKSFRLVGSLLGSVENFKNLSTINSVPLLLSPCEVRLGLENGWFRLINEACDYPTVSTDELNSFNNAREEIYKLQIDRYLDTKILKEKEFRIKYSSQNLNKKNKSNKKNINESDINSNDNGTNNSNNSNNIKNDTNINNDIDNINANNNNINNINNKLELNEEDLKKKLVEKEKILNNFKSFNNDIFIYTSTEEAIENEPTSRVWRDKRNSEDELKYTVFKDLWNRGYYISGGSKFGGTFLVYKGDPFLYHATFIVVLKHYTQEFKALDLLTSSRLAVHVNKTTLFASIDNKSKQPHYISINWRGVT